jgi:hypothetical protein
MEATAMHEGGTETGAAAIAAGGGGALATHGEAVAEVAILGIIAIDIRKIGTMRSGNNQPQSEVGMATG